MSLYVFAKYIFCDVLSPTYSLPYASPCLDKRWPCDYLITTNGLELLRKRRKIGICTSAVLK